MHFRALVAALSFLILPLAACAASTEYKEGTDYRTLTPAMPVTVAKGKVQVMELFWYGCPHCFDMEPEVQRWVKASPGHVEFVRVPAVFNRYNPDGSTNQWYTHAKVFYAAQALGVGEKIHLAMFNAIHQQRRVLRTEEELAALFQEQGVPPKDFKAAFNSFMVDAKIAQAIDLTTKSGIQGVPAIIVAGKYQVLGKQAQSHADYMAIADWLIARERGR